MKLVFPVNEISLQFIFAPLFFALTLPWDGIGKKSDLEKVIFGLAFQL